MRRSMLLCGALLSSLAVADVGNPEGAAMPFPAADAPAATERAGGAPFTAHLTNVNAWCDHMPKIGKPGGRQHMIASVTLKNKSKGPLEVKLARVSISFDPAAEGAPVTGVSVRKPDGLPSGKTSVSLTPGGEVKVDFMGGSLFPEGKHDQTIYLTLVLTAGRDRLVVRGSGRVHKTS